MDSRAMSAGVALLAVLLLGGLSSRAQAAVPESDEFCRPQVVHDYTAPFEQMPKLRQPPASGEIGFGPKSLRLRSVRTLVFGGGEVGFALDLAQRKRLRLPWSAAASLVEVNGNGSPIGKPVRLVRRVGQLKPRDGDSFLFEVPEDPAFYRTTIVFHGAAGQKLGKFSSYHRVLPSTQAARLRLNASAYRLGTVVSARVENFGTTPITYGVEYEIERLEGDTWVRAPESPSGPVIAIALVSPPGRSGARCLHFSVPDTMPSGRYRMVKEVDLPSGTTEEGTERTLTAEFDVVP